MITLHFLKQLELEGFGVVDTDLFWEEAPLDANGKATDGVWIVPRGAPIKRYGGMTQAFDIYSRYTDKVMGSEKLEKILEYLQQAYGELCELPDYPPHSVNQYSNVRITPTSGIENVGKDVNNRVVRVISGQIKYERTN